MKRRYLIGIPLTIAASAAYAYRKRRKPVTPDSDRTTTVRNRAAALIEPKPRRIDDARGRVAKVVRPAE